MQIKSLIVTVKLKRTEDGHKENTQTSTKISTKMAKKQDVRRRDGRTNFILRIKEQETRLNLHEHGDDVDDDEVETAMSLLLF